MLRITADVFSGRQNPVWTVGEERTARNTLRALSEGSELLTEDAPARAGVGFRGLLVESLSDEAAPDLRLGSTTYLPVGREAKGPRAAELAERLIGLLDRVDTSLDTEEGVSLPEPLRPFLTTQLTTATEEGSRSGASIQEGGQETSESFTAAATCYYDVTPFNPGFWNDDQNTRLHNNCYNYASNWRNNTFAQPGRGCGNQYTALTCAEVGRGALCDGMHRRYDCFPDSEWPRHLVALVIWPNTDFHWYRLQSEGYWAHKPGSTAARNVDNSNRVINNPETCDRGPYTQFCGYFYGCHTQRQRIR
ncbi:hypothetical protein [Actinoalloteichus caeruleus]|uniref:hypothetical protein n=1 Tax=Actinoalloteichus cyanogriseus TaxID=2893586 RepID=UPI003AABDA0E